MKLSRLAAAWRDRVAGGIGALVEQAERHARNELATLEQMVAQQGCSEPRLQDAVEEVTRIRAELGERWGVRE